MNPKHQIENEYIEREPEVVITDRAHHFPHLAQSLQIMIRHRIDPLEAAMEYTQEVYRSREYDVEQINKEVGLLNSIQETIAILLKTVWFKKMIKVIVQSSFQGKYDLGQQNRLPTWNNTETFFVNILAYIVSRVWPEYSDDLLTQRSYFDAIAIEQLLEHFKTDMSQVDIFVSEFGNSIRQDGIELTKSLIDALLPIIEHTQYRIYIFSMLYTAPDYLPLIFNSYINYSLSMLTYYKDIGSEASSPVTENSWQFDTQLKISTALNIAYLETPKDLVEFGTEPGAICMTAGTLESDFGRHCYRHRNKVGDQFYLEAIEFVVRKYIRNPNQVLFYRNDNGELISLRIPVRLLGNSKFVRKVIDYRNHLASEANFALD